MEAAAAVGDWCARLGLEPFRARQLLPRLGERPVGRWSGATDLPGTLIAELERQYASGTSRSDLERCLAYTGMNEDECDHVCDTWRNPRVWRVEDGQWVKDCVWGGEETFGPAHVCSDACARVQGAATVS